LNIPNFIIPAETGRSARRRANQTATKPYVPFCIASMRLPFFLPIATLALVPCASAVTVYPPFITDSDGQLLQPSITNTATGPAYSGYTGAFDKAFPSYSI
jgi:hypothetical protein